jgi:uncharacterized protein (TIGR02246 family)
MCFRIQSAIGTERTSVLSALMSAPGVKAILALCAAMSVNNTKRTRPVFGKLALKPKSHRELIMRRVALVIAFLAGLSTPVFAQKAAIDAVNAKWVALFNKGDFAGVASLYTKDATAFPPGSSMVKGRTAIGAMWKGMAEHVSDPKLTTLDVKRLGRSAMREIGFFRLKTKGPNPKEVAGKYVVVWEKVGKSWKLATDIWNDGK